MLLKSTIQLLRFPFSYFLMPLYWFSLSFIGEVDIIKAIAIFIILHLLVYPSSNGYNSYMDRDEGPIGGIENPLQPTKQLFYVSVVLDVIAIVLSLYVSIQFAACIFIYITFSRLYSYRPIRLKQYALVGYLIVVLNQGALTFFMVFAGANAVQPATAPWHGILAATFLIGGFYPITQIYQHKSDANDGVKTISMLLGIKGTMWFCAAMYAIAFSLLAHYYFLQDKMLWFLVLQIFFIPVLVFFVRWMILIYKNAGKADFKHTMQMNWIASTCTSMAFITLIFLKHFG